MRWFFKNVLISFFLIAFSGSIVSAMGRSTYAIRISSGSPLAISQAGGGYLLVLRPAGSVDSGQIIVRMVSVDGYKRWEIGLRIPLQSGQKITSASMTGVSNGYLLAVNRDSIDSSAPSGEQRYGRETIFTKLNETGGVEWQKVTGGEGPDAANLRSLISTTGGFIAAGGAYVSNGNPRITVASFDDAGKTLWGKTYSVATRSTSAQALVLDWQNEKLFFAYGVASGAAVLRIDLNGNLVWSKRVYGSGLRFVSATRSRQHFILLFNHPASHSIYVTRLDQEGQLALNNSYRDSSSLDTRGLTISGNQLAGIGDNNGFIAHFDPNGKISSAYRIEGITAPGMFQGSNELLTGTAAGESMLFRMRGMSVPDCGIFQSTTLTEVTPLAVNVLNFKASSNNWNPRLKQKTVQTFLPTSKEDTRVCYNPAMQPKSTN